MSELIDTTEMYLRTVFELEEEGIVPMRARIAERLNQSGPTVSQTVARMERDGLIARESCASDGRGSYARLTDAGAAKLEAARRTHLAGVRSRFLDHLTPAEQEALGEIWERVLPDGAAQCPSSCG